MHASFELILLGKDGRLLNVTARIREEILLRLTKMTGYQLAGYPGTKWEVLKWPQYIDHMKQISRVFNDIVFLLNREGQTPGDLRKEYFYNGVYYSDVARIEFKEIGDCIVELFEANDNHTNINELVNEYRQESNVRANLISHSEVDEPVEALNGV